MKIAITGANGFVGSNLIRHFQAAGHEVLALVRSVESAELLKSIVKTIVVDYYNPSQLYEALCDIDVVVHNAGKTKALDMDEMMQANVGTTENIITAINSIDRETQLIYISSQAASRPSYGNVPVKESDPPAPLTNYGKSKLQAELLIRSKCNQPYTIVRPCSVYGSHDKDFLTLFKMINKGFSFQIGKQDKLLNMIHVDELAQFISLCLQNQKVYRQTIFATDGKVYRQSQIMRSIARALHKTPKYIVIPDWIARIAFSIGGWYGKLFSVAVIVNKDKMKEIMAPGWVADTTKAKDLLDWNPVSDIDRNLMETAKCYRVLGWL